MRGRPIVQVQLDGPYTRPGLLQRGWSFAQELLRNMDAASLMSAGVLAVLAILGCAHIAASMWRAAT